MGRYAGPPVSWVRGIPFPTPSPAVLLSFSTQTGREQERPFSLITALVNALPGTRLCQRPAGETPFP